jgi:uncharacterized protein YecE (DUF72 family)
LLVYGGRLGDEFLSAGAEEDRVSRVLRRQFNTVEMDATFYGVPSESTVSRWYEQTPENCVFGCNVLQAITHDAGPVDCDDQFLELVNVMSRMKHKPGPMLFQFPYCNRKSPVRLREFIDRLRGFLPKLPAELRFTLEIGNKDWVGPGIAGTAQETQGRLGDDRPPTHPCLAQRSSCAAATS